MAEKKWKVRYVNSYTETPYEYTTYVLRYTDNGCLELLLWYGDLDASVLIHTFEPYSTGNDYQNYINEVLGVCSELISKSKKGKTFYAENILKYEPNTKRWLTAKKKKDADDMVGKSMAEDRVRAGIFY